MENETLRSFLLSQKGEWAGKHKEFYRVDPPVRVRVWWRLKGELVETITDVTEVWNQCFMGRIVSGAPCHSGGKVFWAVERWEKQGEL